MSNSVVRIKNLIYFKLQKHLKMFVVFIIVDKILSLNAYK